LSCGLELFVIAVANLLWRRTTRRRVAVNLDQLELFDGDRLAILEYLEVVLREVGDWLRLLVRNDHIHADEVDAAAEHRLLTIALRGGLIALWLSGLALICLTLLRLPLRALLRRAPPAPRETHP